MAAWPLWGGFSVEFERDSYKFARSLACFLPPSLPSSFHSSPSLSSFLYVCRCTCVLCMERLEVNLSCHCSGAARPVSHWSGAIGYADCPPATPSSPSTGTTSGYHHAWLLFSWVLGFQARALALARLARCRLL